MSTDIVYPVLIGIVCLVIAVIVHLVTRPKPTRADIAVPASSARAAAPPSEVDPDEALSAWHREHEEALLDFFDRYDDAEMTVVDELADPDGESQAVDELRDAEGYELIARMERAVVSHPSPEMQAELAAMRSAAEAMAISRGQGDDETAARHAEVYEEYREQWLDRLWQYPSDPDRVADTRSRS